MQLEGPGCPVEAQEGVAEGQAVHAQGKTNQAYQVEAQKGLGAKQQPELSSADPAGEGGSSMPNQHLHIQTRPQRTASG